jgi:hypothetical protein
MIACLEKPTAIGPAPQASMKPIKKEKLMRYGLPLKKNK